MDVGPSCGCLPVCYGRRPSTPTTGGGRSPVRGYRHVTHDYYETLSPIRRPQRGDVLYSLVGSFGIPALVKVDQPFCVQRHIAIVRPSRHISPPFLAYALASPVAYDQASACATGT